MAKTKNRRRRKHRGTQAGTVDHAAKRTRDAKEKPRSREEAREIGRRRRLERLDRPPTWRSALNRAALASAVLAVLIVFVLRPDGPLGERVAYAALIAVFMLLIYVPLGYFFDSALFRWRQRKKAAGG